MENILMQSMVSILQMFVFTIYLKEILGLRHSVVWMPLLWILLEIVDRSIVKMADSPGINGLVYLILLEIIVFLIGDGSWKKKLFITLAFSVVITVLEILLINVVIIFEICDLNLISNDIKISSLILILTQMLAFIFFHVIIYYCKHQIKGETSIKDWLGILLISGGCFVAVLVLTMNMINYNNFSMGYVIVLVILICLNFLSYYFYSISLEKRKIEMETRIYQKQIAVYQERYQDIQQTRKDVCHFQHDINNHLSIIQKLCEDAKEKRKPEECMYEIEKYLKNIGITYDTIFHDTDSENLMIDSIIDMKKGSALSKGIDMVTELYIPPNMKYDSLDMVIILGNLLDNAIEACEKLMNKKKPEIILKIQYKMSNLVILIKNTYDGEEIGAGNSVDNSLPATTKNDKKIHGIGMRNVKEIIKKYNGIIEWRTEYGMFGRAILLYEFDKNGENKGQ